MSTLMNQQLSLFLGDSFNNLPELLVLMEHGTSQQSAEAAHQCFDQLLLEPLADDCAQVMVSLLMDLLHKGDQWVAKTVILNRMTEFLIREWDVQDVFGMTAPYGPAQVRQTEGSSVWRRIMSNRLTDLLKLIEDEEATAIQAIYAVHLLQSHDERIETELLQLTLNTSSLHVRLNGLMALADYRRRTDKSFNPSIAFGHMNRHPLYEEMRSVSMGIVSRDGGMRDMDMEALMRGIAMPRADRTVFPWANGSPAACCAQAARMAMRELGWSETRMIHWWKEALNNAIKSHRDGCKVVTWEVGHAEVEWDEECLQWYWNAPMLVADNMLHWWHDKKGTIGAFEEQPEELRDALRIVFEHSIEVPRATFYGVKHLLFPAHYR